MDGVDKKCIHSILLDKPLKESLLMTWYSWDNWSRAVDTVCIISVFGYWIIRIWMGVYGLTCSCITRNNPVWWSSWVFALCRFVSRCQHLRETRCFHIQDYSGTISYSFLISCWPTPAAFSTRNPVNLFTPQARHFRPEAGDIMFV